jgi:hypothetical protein
MTPQVQKRLLVLALLMPTIQDLESSAKRGTPLRLDAVSQEDPGLQFQRLHGTWDVSGASFQMAGRQTYHFFDDKLIISSYDTGGKAGPRHVERLARQHVYSMTAKTTKETTKLALIPFPDKDANEPQYYSVRVVDGQLSFSSGVGWAFSLKRVKAN